MVALKDQLFVGLLLLFCFVRLEALQSSSSRRNGVRGWSSSFQSSLPQRVGEHQLRYLQDKNNNKNNKDDSNNGNDDAIQAAEEDGAANNGDENPAAQEEAVVVEVATEEPPPADDDHVTEATDPALDGEAAAGEEGNVAEAAAETQTETEAVALTSAPAEEISATQEEPASSGVQTPTTTGDVSYHVKLADFYIQIDYAQPVTEDPGIEAYLKAEMKETFGNNLADVDLEFADLTVSERRTRRSLLEQVLAYKGTALFKGEVVYTEAAVLSAQSEILKNSDAITAVIIYNLGVKAEEITISAVEIDEDSIPESEGEGGLNKTTRIVAIVFGVLGGFGLAVVAFIMVTGKEKDQPKSPIAKSTTLAPELQYTDRKVQEEDANATLDTPNATFETVASSEEPVSPPVQAQASVARGTLKEVRVGGEPVRGDESD